MLFRWGVWGGGGGGVGHGFCVWIGFTVEKPADCFGAGAEVTSSTLYRASKESCHAWREMELASSSLFL